MIKDKNKINLIIHYVSCIIIFLSTVIYFWDSIRSIIYNTALLLIDFYDYIFFSTSFEWFKKLSLYSIFCIFSIFFIYYLLFIIINYVMEAIKRLRDKGDSQGIIFKFDKFYFILYAIFILIVLVIHYIILKNRFELNLNLFIMILFFSAFFNLIYYIFFNIKKRRIEFLKETAHQFIKLRLNYSLLVLVLMMVAFFTSAIVLSKSFPTELPRYDVKCREGSIMNCLQVNGYNNFIDKETIKCEFNFDKSINSKNDLDVSYMYHPIQDGIKQEWVRKNVSELYINQANRLYLRIYKNESIVTIEFEDIKGNSEGCLLGNYEVYSKEEYKEKEREKFRWLFAVISLSFFTVLSGVNNLKEILKKDNEEKEKGKK